MVPEMDKYLNMKAMESLLLTIYNIEAKMEASQIELMSTKAINLCLKFRSSNNNYTKEVIPKLSKIPRVSNNNLILEGNSEYLF
jgi:hypothetical protein